MGREVGPAFQRRYRDTPRVLILASGWRERGPGTWIPMNPAFWCFGRGITYKMREFRCSGCLKSEGSGAQKRGTPSPQTPYPTHSTSKEEQHHINA
eukprot:gene24397-biopygen4407